MFIWIRRHWFLLAKMHHYARMKVNIWTSICFFSNHLIAAVNYQQSRLLLSLFITPIFTYQNGHHPNTILNTCNIFNFISFSNIRFSFSFNFLCLIITYITLLTIVYFPKYWLNKNLHCRVLGLSSCMERYSYVYVKVRFYWKFSIVHLILYCTSA